MVNKRRVWVKPKEQEQQTPNGSHGGNQPSQDSDVAEEEVGTLMRSDEDQPWGKGKTQATKKGDKRQKTAAAAQGAAGNRVGWRRGNVAATAQEQRQLQQEIEPAEDDARVTEEQRVGRLLDDQDQGCLASGEVRTRGLAGHLKKITLQNFMCHENFEMEFR